MLCKVQLCVLLCLGVYLARGFTPECTPFCDPASCPSVQCQHGTVLDLCGCCTVCGQGLGEQCAANYESLSFYGSCVDGLVCISPYPDYTYYPGTCTALERGISSSTLPQPTSTQTRWFSSSTKVVVSAPTTRIEPSATTANPVLTATSASANVWTTTSGAPPQPSASSSTLVTTASSMSLTATPAPIPTNSTNNTDACRELCSVGYCRSSSSNVCSAQGDLAFQPVSQRGVCQHTACGACFILLSPDCPNCPDPATPSCLKQYSTCVSNFYFQNVTNTALMRLDDPRAASAHGRLLCQVSSVENSLTQSSIRRAVRRVFGLSTRNPASH